MCRLAAYIGHDPMPLSALIYDPPHSLEHASYAPRELLSGTVNVDGTGVAWWPTATEPPLRYVTAHPPWSDANLPALAPRLSGTSILAAVRSATPGLPFGPSNVAPFVTGRIAGVHNGWIGGFRDGMGRTMLADLSDERFGQLDAMNDSLALFLLVAQYLDDQPDSSISDALIEVVARTAKIVTAASEKATLNVVIASGSEVIAARTSVGTEVNSLYTLSKHGHWLSSEPLDRSDDWQPVPEHSLVRMTAEGVTTSALEHDWTAA